MWGVQAQRRKKKTQIPFSKGEPAMRGVLDKGCESATPRVNHSDEVKG